MTDPPRDSVALRDPIGRSAVPHESVVRRRAIAGRVTAVRRATTAPHGIRRPSPDASATAAGPLSECGSAEAAEAAGVGPRFEGRAEGVRGCVDVRLRHGGATGHDGAAADRRQLGALPTERLPDGAPKGSLHYARPGR
ncbi:hypothetical protein GA0115260_113083, partial [Streptomyces sp. MnatMP-M27]|uniref:hypothetical protein n=1 Tax=Streptomyces sp. MnatMP-M27 TaxID=1839768 RepID=UPI00081E9D5E